MFELPLELTDAVCPVAGENEGENAPWDSVRRRRSKELTLPPACPVHTHPVQCAPEAYQLWTWSTGACKVFTTENRCKLA